MVRAVDDVLRSTFGLAEGLADRAPWGAVAGLIGVDVPHGVDPDAPFLSMIDPGAGTGTFLVEWIRRAAILVLGAAPPRRVDSAVA